MADLKGTVITWLGHSTVLVVTAKGTSILIDPFIENNPKFPKHYKLPESLDLVLATHAHSDHIADLIPVAQKYDANVVAIVELVGWAQSKGVRQGTGINFGGTWRYKDVAISLVEAKHSTSIEDGGKLIYAGEPAGFIIAIEDGPVLYHAGDTAVFSDMQLIRELYKPDVAMLPIGDHYTMGPQSAALAAKYIGAKTILPIHYGTFPALTGTPEALKGFLGQSEFEVKGIQPGESIR